MLESGKEQNSKAKCEVLNRTHLKEKRNTENCELQSLFAFSAPVLSLQMLFTSFQGWQLIKMSQEMHCLPPDKEDTVDFIQNIWRLNQRMQHSIYQNFDLSEMAQNTCIL